MNVDKLVADLTLDEKAALTAGADLWHTVAVERAGIPSWRMTDGPNGARGTSFAGGSPSLSVPCGSGLGATWDPALLEAVGEAIGDQARTKGARILLAPTVNLHRSPLGGRTFESYGEDPLHVGTLAAAFVRGVQSQGVATTVKHFAGNEAEFERQTIDSVIDERTLRELYLLPFELAVRDGGSLGIMTAYNRLNGRWCTEHPELLGILRDEWGFEGVVVTDWYGIDSTVGSATAGVDIEMPGPARQLGGNLADAVRAGELDERVLDGIVRRILGLFDRLGALEDGAPGEEASVDRPEHRALARRAVTESIVLLRNDGSLPLDATAVRSIAVIGPNADRAQIIGGGSATLEPHYRVTPLEALRRRLGDAVAIAYEQGCDIDRSIPPMRAELEEVVFDADGAELRRRVIDTAHLMYLGPPVPEAGERWQVRASGTWVPAVDGPHQLTLVQAGRARLLIDGAVVLDGVTDPPPLGSAMFGAASEEIATVVDVRAGEPIEVTIELSNEGASVLAGVTVGARALPADDLLDRAVAAAAAADVAIVVVGTNDDWESEGHDRTTLELPGAQDELVRRVCAANARTVVVVNAGSPVDLPWADDPAAVLDMWFGGQEMADGLVDVLLGAADPGGRLPTTFPMRVEHTPAFGNFPGEHGEVRYGEGLLMGYRWYETRQLPVRFPFGHGLSYAAVELGAPKLSGSSPLVVDVPVTNAGTRPGSAVVQCYVEPVDPPVFRPHKELKAFAKVAVEPGQTVVARLTLDDRAFAYWRPDLHDYAGALERQRTTSFALVPTEDPVVEPGWCVAPGEYRLHIGRSSADIEHVLTHTIN